MHEETLTLTEHEILNALLDDVPLTIIELVRKTELPHETVVLTLPQLGERGHLRMGGDGKRKMLLFTLSHSGSAVVARADERPGTSQM